MKFDQMDLTHKLEALQEVLATKIKPMLAADGGGLEVIDIKEAPNGELQLFIRYVGACATCASGGATLFAIEETLRKELDTQQIRIFSV
ncbi:MAG: NifU family protein [Epsilonproteobacteria bacterium]|nr:NifU family protein [Campylobacterota bacterium]